jgi:hypothetical protein
MIILDLIFQALLIYSKLDLSKLSLNFLLLFVNLISLEIKNFIFCLKLNYLLLIIVKNLSNLLKI